MWSKFLARNSVRGNAHAYCPMRSLSNAHAYCTVERTRLLPNEVTVLVLGLISRDNARNVLFSLELAVAVQ